MQELLDSVKSLSGKQRKALAALLKKQKVNLYGVTPIFKREPDEQPLLSYAQQRQWFLWQLEPDSSAYNIASALSFKGALNLEALQKSFQALIDRHETLRTTFALEGEQPVQVIHANVLFELGLETLEVMDESTVRHRFELEAARPFDLFQGPLLRVKLLQLSVDEHVLILTMHHIISDGWSMPIMVSELVQLYSSHCQGQEVDLPALPIQYADYAIWQRNWMETGERERQLAYWQAQLGGEQPVLELPTNRSRPVVRTYAGDKLNIELDSALVRSLKQLANHQGVTVFMLLLASFQMLLQRYTGQNDIRVGVPIANRTRVETEQLIGFFVNTQVLKAEFDLNLSFNGLLQQVRQTVLDAQSHQDLPFQQLVEALHPERSLSHNPLFQVMYNHQTHVKGKGIALPGLEVVPLAYDNPTAQFDLTLDTFESESGLWASLTFATELFDQPVIARMARHWVNLLQAIVHDPQQRIAELPLLEATEYQKIVKEWNRTETDLPDGHAIHELIEAQVEKTPHATAVVLGEQSLSYAELNLRANRLAHQLREHGVAPNVLVGLAVEYSLEMVVGLLAILKAGGAYVPLDPLYPQDRLAYMIDDSGITLLLTTRPLRQKLSVPETVQVLELDQKHHDETGYSDTNLVNGTSASNLVYVIYTSGSTGQPKGAAVRVGSFVRLLQWYQDICKLSASDRVMLLSSYSFDLTQKNVYGVLCVGGQLHLPTSRYDPDYYCNYIERHEITLVNCAPSAFHPLLHGHHFRLRSLRNVLLGGEAVQPAELSSWAEAAHTTNVMLHNTYGPTECTDVVIGHSVSSIDVLSLPNVPIGRPLPGITSYLLDGAGEPVAVGVVGELYIGGNSVGDGYWKRPGLTAERFVPDVFNSSGQGSGRLYRTGDLARYRPDGVLEYIGRIDHQVKIRGLRIELGEITARLQEHEAVREAAVIDVNVQGSKQLAAYVVPQHAGGQQKLKDALRDYAQSVLPDYMVPAHFLFLEKMPLSPNGKLDRKALPIPEVSHHQDYVEPRTVLEKKIALIWSEVLKQPSIGLEDNFFELGGDSIVSIQVVSRARQVGIHFTTRQLFQQQTVRRLAAIATVGDVQALDIDQGPVVGQAVLLPIQQWFFDADIPECHHWNQAILLNATKRLEAGPLEQALQALVLHHDALRLRFTDQEQ